MAQKFSLRDLITLAIFAVLTTVVDFCCGLLGLTFVGFLIFPLLFALISGPITIFYMRKEPRPWMTFALFFLMSLIILLGHSWLFVVQGVVWALIAEFLRRSNGYNTARGLTLAHMFGCCVNLGFFLEIFLVPTWYREANLRGGSSVERLDKILTLQWWILPLLFIGILICGYIGAKFGQKLTDKHFKKAGMVD